MKFKERYTTNEKIQTDKTLEVKDQTGEDKKTIISNDAYAVGETMEQFTNCIMATLRGMVK